MKKKFYVKQPKNVWLEGSYVDKILAMKRNPVPVQAFAKNFKDSLNVALNKTSRAALNSLLCYF